MISFTNRAGIKRKSKIDFEPGTLSEVAVLLTKRAYELTQTITQLERLDPDHVEFENLRQIVGDQFTTDQQAHVLREQFISGYQSQLSELRDQFVSMASTPHIPKEDAENMFEQIKKKAIHDLDNPSPQTSPRK